MEKQNRISGRTWLIVGIVWIGYIVVNLANFSIGIMMPDIKKELQLTLEMSGWLSASSWILKALFSIPISLLLSKFNAKSVIRMVFTLVSVGLILQGLSVNYAMLFIGRALVFGVAAAILAPLAVVKIGLIPKEKMSWVNGIENFTGPAGQMMGTALAPLLIASFSGWRNTLLFMGVISIIVTVLWSIFCKKEDGLPAASSTGTVEKIPFFDPLKEAAKYKSVWLLALSWWGTGLIWNATYTFWPTYAQDTLGLTLTQAGLVLGLLPIGSMVGSLTSPKIADKLGYDKPMICSWGFLLPLFYYGMMLTPNIALLCVLSFLAGYGAYAFVPLAFTSIYKLDGISPRAVSIGIAMILTTNGLGGALGGMLSGYLGQSLGLATALKICCLSPLVFGVMTLFLPETGRKATERKKNA
ncbi:MFS transporter [Caproiciproducens sp.]